MAIDPALSGTLVTSRSTRARSIVGNIVRSPSAAIGFGLLALHVLLALTAPLLATHDPVAIDYAAANAGPGAGHLLGTDSFGRDVLSRVLYGGRAAMVIALCATVIAVTVGTLVGLTLGYFGRAVDEVGSRVLDAVLAIPPIIILLVVLTSLGSGRWVLIVAMAAAFAPGSARVARAASLDIITRDFIAAARARGESSLSIIVREIGPNVRDVMLVEFAMRASWSLLLISALSFLGFGVNPPTPDWGLMVAENRDSLSIAPWSTAFPIVALGSLVIALNLASDGLAKALGLDLTRGAPG